MTGYARSDTRPATRWRIASGQRLVWEDFDDGIVMFDGRVGQTHLLNVTAAETLAILNDAPGLETTDIHRELLARLEVDSEALPLDAVDELLSRLEDLNLVRGEA